MKQKGFSLLEVVLSMAILGMSLPILLKFSAEGIANSHDAIRNIEIANAEKSIQNYLPQNAGSLEINATDNTDKLYFYQNESDQWTFSSERPSLKNVFVLQLISSDTTSFAVKVYRYLLGLSDHSGNLDQNLQSFEISTFNPM